MACISVTVNAIKSKVNPGLEVDQFFLIKEEENEGQGLTRDTEGVTLLIETKLVV